MAQRFRLVSIAILAMVLGGPAVVRAQPATADRAAAQTQPSSDAVPSAPSATSPATVPSTQSATALIPPPPIPLGQINTKADPDADDAKQIEAESAGDELIGEISDDLPAIRTEVEARAQETTRLLAAAPSLADLRAETDWQAIDESLGEWRAGLTTRAQKLDENVGRLDELDVKWWSPTLTSIRAANEPPELIRQAESVIATVRQSRETVERRRATVLSLQSRVRELSVQVGNTLTLIRNAQDQARNRLLVRDSPPIWDLRNRTAVATESQQSIRTQWAALLAYARASQ